jgi:purine nucleosidase
MTRKILLDCDPGHDDAVAILLAVAADELDLQALTVVGGNVPLDLTELNARKVLALAGHDQLPVYAGCPRPMIRRMVTAENVHGESGLDSGSGQGLPEPTAGLAPGHAVDIIVDTVRRLPPGELTLVATGPLTNVAMAMIKAPEIIDRLGQLVLMGGAGFEPGNITPAAEFNIYVDPHAARVVFESGAPIVMFGLDVTHQMLITPPRLQKIRDAGGRTGPVVADLLDFFNRYDTAKYGWDGAPLHDPCTIAWLLEPGLFQGKPMNVEVETSEGPAFGRTIADWFGVTDKPANAHVIQTGQAEEFFDLITDRLALL